MCCINAMSGRPVRRVRRVRERGKKSRVSSYAEAFRLYAQHSEDQLVIKIEKIGAKRPYEREIRSAKRIAVLESNSNMIVQQDDGMQRYLAFQRIFRTEFMYSPSPFQMEFFDKLLIALMVILFGKDWGTYGPGVCAALGLDEIMQRLAITAARRHGKSVAMAMGIAALCLVLPGPQAIFSTSQRISDAMKEMVMNFIRNSRYANRLSARGGGGEKVIIRSGLDDNTSEIATLKFLPAAHKISFKPRIV